MNKWKFQQMAGLALAVLIAIGVGCGKREPSAAGPSTAAPAAAAGAPAAPPEASSTDLARDSMEVDGQVVEIAHSPFDMGRIQDMFDDKKETVARTLKANPAILTLTFSKPRTLKGIELTTATMDINLKCVATLEGGGEKTFTQEFRNLPPDPTVTLDFPGLSAPVRVLHIEISDARGGDGHIHIRTLRLL